MSDVGWQTRGDNDDAMVVPLFFTLFFTDCMGEVAVVDTIRHASDSNRPFRCFLGPSGEFLSMLVPASEVRLTRRSLVCVLVVLVLRVIGGVVTVSPGVCVSEDTDSFLGRKNGLVHVFVLLAVTAVAAFTGVRGKSVLVAIVTDSLGTVFVDDVVDAPRLFTLTVTGDTLIGDRDRAA